MATVFCIDIRLPGEPTVLLSFCPTLKYGGDITNHLYLCVCVVVGSHPVSLPSRPFRLGESDSLTTGFYIVILFIILRVQVTLGFFANIMFNVWALCLTVAKYLCVCHFLYFHFLYFIIDMDIIIFFLYFIIVIRELPV